MATTAGIDLPLEVADEGALTVLRQIRAEGDKTAETLKKAFAADVLVENLGRVATAFGGVTGEAVNAAGAIARGFLQGGPVGAALAGTSVAVVGLVDLFGAQAEAAEKAAKARAESLAAETKAVEDVTAKLRDQLLVLEDIARARGEGITESQAKALRNVEELGKAFATTSAEVARLNALINTPGALAPGLTELAREDIGRLLREQARVGEELKLAGAKLAEDQARAEGEAADKAKAQGEAEAARLRERRTAEEVDAAKRRAAALLAVEESLAAEKRHLIDAEAEINRFANLQMWADERAAAEREAASLAAEAETEVEITRIANEHIARLNREADREEELARQERLDKEKSAAAKRYQYAQLALSGTQALVDTVWGLEEAQKNATAVELEEQAKRAAVKAIFATAEAALYAAAGQFPSAVAAGFAAAQFAIVAGSSAIAAGNAPTATSPTPGLSTFDRGAAGSSAPSSSSRSSRSSRDRGSVTLVYNSQSGVFQTREELSRDLQTLVDAANRRR